MPTRRVRLIRTGKESRNREQPRWQPLFGFLASGASSSVRSSLGKAATREDARTGCRHASGKGANNAHRIRYEANGTRNEDSYEAPREVGAN